MYDYNTEECYLTSSARKLLEVAASTPVTSFPLVARATATTSSNNDDKVYYETEDSSNAGHGASFRTSTDRAISKYSGSVSTAAVNTAIRSFVGRMPSGPRKMSEGNSIGFHRARVSLTAAYMDEKTDPNHRMGDLIREFAAIAPPNVNLFAWMDSLSYFEVCHLMRTQLNKQNGFVKNFAPAFMRGVKYLNAAGRVSYQVMIDDGVLQWGGRSLDTKEQQLETVFSGLGWGIWVLSPEGNFYTASHKKGEFHHSSFLSGEPVKAAGEWRVVNGQIDTLTGKTGHYKCDVAALVFALRKLKSLAALPAAAKVNAWKNGQAAAVGAHEFLNNNALQEQYSSFGSAPLETPVRTNSGWRSGGVTQSGRESRQNQSRGSMLGSHR